jgi:quaternary ammonium compound-resistance protein SugE
MPWVLLFLAGLLEVVFAVSLKNSDGFTRPFWVALFIVAAAFSFFFLSLSLRFLPVGVAYAVWTGIGATGTALVGMIWLGESRDVLKLLSLVLVVVGLAGLRLTSAVAH